MFFVRTATESDISAIRELLAVTWHATYDGILGVDRVNAIAASWHTPEALKLRVNRKDGEFLVADDGKRLGGMAYAAPDHDRDGVINFSQLYVHPDFQRQGIGRDLFAEIETCFPHAKRLSLEVEPENTGAIAFYRAHGLEETGRTENCGGCGTGIPAIIMEKDLPGA